VLDEHSARPEQINEAPIAGQLLDRLLESGNGAATDTKDVEEFVPESLAFGGFASFAIPVFAKGNGADTTMTGDSVQSVQRTDSEAARPTIPRHLRGTGRSCRCTGHRALGV
jgi:hypothetical protein